MRLEIRKERKVTTPHFMGIDSSVYLTNPSSSIIMMFRKAGGEKHSSSTILCDSYSSNPLAL